MQVPRLVKIKDQELRLHWGGGGGGFASTDFCPLSERRIVWLC